MINKNEFVEIINKLMKANKLQNDVNELFRNARDNIENDLCNGASLMISHDGIVIKLLENIFEDEYEIISWWIYETDYGRNEKLSTIFNLDDTVHCVLSSPEQLYDYLVECMGDKNEQKNT